MKPLIGIITRPEYTTGKNEMMGVYQEINIAVLKNGGRTIGILPNQIETFVEKTIDNTTPVDNWEELKHTIDLCDGIIAQGGDDYYDYDLKIIEYCHNIDKPILGICLGMQTMGVALKGKLEKKSAPTIHKKSKKQYVHTVKIDPDSKLYTILKKRELLVNSHHLDQLKINALNVVAYSEDGIIEAVEDKNKTFFIGVQWHPESLIEYDIVENRLFAYFIECCKKEGHMKLSDILEIINGKQINTCQIKGKINQIGIDTRTLKKGDIYIAIKGQNYDGNEFLKEAEKKASLIITEKKQTNIKKVPVIKVENTLDTLVTLGTFFRRKYDTIPLIAVTGSVGKTTTKKLICDILKTEYNVLKSKDNYNNHIGVPLTLFHLNKSYDIAVLELGMNHPKEIEKLSKICKPNIAIITNIGSSHIGNLGSKKNILKAKMEIIQGMENGVLILNGQDEYLKKVKEDKIPLIKCGKDILTPFDVKLDREKTTFSLKIEKETHTFQIHVPGEKIIHNVILAIQIGLLFQIPIETIKQVLENFQMEKNRLSIYQKNEIEFIDDCYNASFESIENSLQVLKMSQNKKMIILGDVLELGKFSKKYHKKIGKLLKNIKDTEILLVGEEVKYIKNKQALHFKNKEQILNYLKTKDLKGYTILMKASHGMHLEELPSRILELDKI